MKLLNNIKKKIKYNKDYENFSNLDFPKRIEVGTNSVCNARCRICPYPETFKDLPKNDIGDEVFKKIIDECAKYKIKEVSPFLFNDPLTDSKLIERMEYIIKKIPNVKIIIHTNGGLLTKEKSEKIANLFRTQDSINFSFHGGITEESYKKEMGINLSKTLENIKTFFEVSKGKKFEILIHNRTLNNKKEFERFRNFWVEHGAKPENINDGGGLVTRAENVQDKGVGEHVIHKKLYGCSWDRPLKIMHILNNGDVIICCMDWRKEVVIGNVKEKSLYEIWHSDEYKKIRDIIYGKIKNNNPNFICNRCEVAN